MPSFTLRQLEYFIAVVDAGTLTGAAATLHVSPGALSSAISDLERVLGVEVFERRRAKGAALTPAGHDLEAHARSVLGAADELQAAAGATRGEVSGPLFVGCFDTLTPLIVPPLLEHFARVHPRVRLTVHEHSSDEIQELIANGALSAGFVYRRHTSMPLSSLTIAPARPQVVLPADHPLAAQEIVWFDQLSDLPAVLLGLRPSADIVTATLREAGFEPNVRHLLKNPEAVRSAVGRGLGYSILMPQPRGGRTYSGHRLAYRPIGDPMPENSVELIHQPTAERSAKIRALRHYSTTGLADATSVLAD